MNTFMKIYNFLLNNFKKIPLYLRGIAIFTIFLFISIIINAITKPKYYYGSEGNEYIVSDTIKNDDTTTIKKTLKSNLKISAPVAKIETNSKNNKNVKLPNALRNFWNDNVFGSQRAPVTIVDFSSYNCPYCITFQNNVFNQINENYIKQGKVRYVKKIIIQKNTLYAVMLPHCVSSEDTKYNIIKNLYEKVNIWLNLSNQKNELQTIAVNNGFSVDGFNNCINDSKLANELLQKQKTEIAELKVNSTPTLFINGKKYNGDLSYETLSKYIDNIMENMN